MTEQEKEKYMENQIESWCGSNPLIHVVLEKEKSERPMTVKEQYAIAKHLSFGQRWGSNTSIGGAIGGRFR